MKKQFLFYFSGYFLSSCATATLSEFPGVGRVKQYDFIVMIFHPLLMVFG